MTDTLDVWVAYKGYPFLVDRPRQELVAFKCGLGRGGQWNEVFSGDSVQVARRSVR